MASIEPMRSARAIGAAIPERVAAKAPSVRPRDRSGVGARRGRVAQAGHRMKPARRAPTGEADHAARRWRRP